jgi:Erv1 / Alr family
MVSEIDLAIAAIPRIRSKKAWSRVTWLHIWQHVTSYPDAPSQ